MNVDIAIVGAGPSGLCLAKSLSGQNLKIALIEQQDEGAISKPLFDGREIALTQQSAKTMKTLGLWDLIEPHAISPLRDAKILDGRSQFEMLIPHQLSHYQELGWLISNHLIRQAAYDAVQKVLTPNGDITLICGHKVVKVKTDETNAKLTLDDGLEINAKLVVAADNRFSTTRRMMGIAADMHDFGRNMLVCCMTHDVSHDHIAWEWFDYGQTLALLPMNPDLISNHYRSSVVITVPSDEAEELMKLSPEAFSKNAKERFGSRLGEMNLISSIHSYPLVSVYPKRLVSTRFATVGDAAVGMHPVTAHGFNFGLLGVKKLSEEIVTAHKAARDIGDQALLLRYQRSHRLKTKPLFLMTRLITDIYTKESPPAKLLRKALLHISERVTPFKRSIATSLTGR
jgi:ubiquinone biosynthesis UbiH/UbiF/VisC/COQ6 family hydroxylase